MKNFKTEAEIDKGVEMTLPMMKGAMSLSRALIKKGVLTYDEYAAEEAPVEAFFRTITKEAMMVGHGLKPGPTTPEGVMAYAKHMEAQTRAFMEGYIDKFEPFKPEG